MRDFFVVFISLRMHEASSGCQSFAMMVPKAPTPLVVRMTKRGGLGRGGRILND